MFTETPYTFKTITDDGVVLKINGAVVISDLAQGPAADAYSIALTAGTTCTIEMDYFHGSGGWNAQLHWLSADPNPGDPGYFAEEAIEPVTPVGVNFEVDPKQFADVVKFASYTNPATTTNSVDGWPTQDFQLTLFSGGGESGQDDQGTYLLQFNGEAQVTDAYGPALDFQVGGADYGNTLPFGVGFNGTTTTATVTVPSLSAWGQMQLAFTKTQRDGGGAGVTNIHLMLPTTLNGTTDYPVGTLLTNAALAEAAPFSTLRMMDWTTANINNEVNWSDRALPTANFWQQTSDHSMPWETAVAMANATGKDLYINIPTDASDAYITDLADLLKYGSNGVNPYTSPQADPVWAPLDSNLNIYIEYANEVWNFSSPVYSEVNNLVLQNEQNDTADWQLFSSAGGWVTTNSSGAATSSDTSLWTVVKDVDISNIFRQVFGDAVMPANAQGVVNADPRIRSVFEWQYGGGWNGGSDASDQAMRDLSAQLPHAINYYIWGGGGGWYADDTTGGFSDVQFANPDFDSGAADWTFSRGAGIVANGSTMGNPNSPTEVAPSSPAKTTTNAVYLQPGASISQSVYFSGGYADLTLYVAQTAADNSANGLQITIDGQAIEESEGSSIGSLVWFGSQNAWGWDRSAAFDTGASAGRHTITFTNTGTVGSGVTIFLDNFGIQTVNGLFNEEAANGLPGFASVQNDVLIDLQFGLHDVGYEGGFDFNQNLGNDDINGYSDMRARGYSSAAPNVAMYANLDPRAQQLAINTIDQFYQDGGALPFLYESTGNNNSWAVVAPGLYSALDETTSVPKVEAVVTVGQSLPPAPTDGAPAPGPGGAPVIQDGGFANPNVVGNGNYTYDPTGTPWTFTGTAGIEADGSAWRAVNAPDGDGRAAFLQGTGGGPLGAISQFLYLTPGTYTVSFEAARRNGFGLQPIQFRFEGANLGSPITPSSTSWGLYTTTFTLTTAGTYAIQFAATSNSGDNDSFIDDVSIAEGTPAAPATPTINTSQQAGQQRHVSGQSPSPTRPTPSAAGTNPTGTVTFTLYNNPQRHGHAAVHRDANVRPGRRRGHLQSASRPRPPAPTTGWLPTTATPTTTPSPAARRWSRWSSAAPPSSRTPASPTPTSSPTAATPTAPRARPGPSPAPPASRPTAAPGGRPPPRTATAGPPSSRTSAVFLSRCPWRRGPTPPPSRRPGATALASYRSRSSVAGMNVGGAITPSKRQPEAQGLYTTTTFTITTAGNYTIRFAGTNNSGDNDSFIDAVSIAAGTPAAPATPAINTSQQPASAAVGSYIADKATVSGGANPTGTVTFTLYSNATASGTPLYTDANVALVGGMATSTGYTATATGTDFWVATYNGDANNAAVSSGTASEPVVISAASPAISTSQQPASAVVGGSIADKATVSGGANPTGTVTFTLYNNPNGTGTPLYTDANVALVGGVATSVGYTATTTGTDYWVAAYNGDANNAAVSSGTASEPVVISAATPAISTTQQPASATVGSSIADKATVSGGDNPTGTVTFTLYNNPNATGTPLYTDANVALVSGVATSEGYTATTTGTDYWVAAYNGDANNNPVTSGTASEPVVVSAASPAINTSQQPASAVVGGSIADKATVTGGANPTGTVTFTLYNNPNGTGTPLYTDANVALVGGVATSVGYTATTTGTDYWVAAYNGDGDNASVTSGASDEPVTVSAASPAINTTQQPASATVGASIADKATVTGGDNPTGTVTFNLYSNPNATGTPLYTDANVALVGGVATSVGYTATTTGTDYWVATYNGDANNNPVTSGTASEPVVVSAASPAINTSQQPANAVVGGSIADKATVSGGDNPTGTVTFHALQQPDRHAGHAAVHRRQRGPGRRRGHLRGLHRHDHRHRLLGGYLQRRRQQRRCEQRHGLRSRWSSAAASPAISTSQQPASRRRGRLHCSTRPPSAAGPTPPAR